MSIIRSSLSVRVRSNSRPGSTDAVTTLARLCMVHGRLPAMLREGFVSRLAGWREDRRRKKRGKHMLLGRDDLPKIWGKSTVSVWRIMGKQAHIMAVFISTVAHIALKRK